MSRGKKPRIVDVDMDAVQGLLERAKGRLSTADYDLLQGLVESLLYLVGLVQKGRVTIARLRRLIGLDSSEKTANVLPNVDGDEEAASSGTSSGEETQGPGKSGGADGAGGERKKKRKGHGRLGIDDYPDATHIHVCHESLHPGDRCPKCDKRTLFELKEPARILRILGQPPLVAYCWNCQRLRCSWCGFVFTAQAPVEARGEKFSESAAATIVMNRYSLGMPFNRLAQHQLNLKTPIPPSTQWDVVNGRATEVLPVFRELIRVAAQGSGFHNDDTYARILEYMGKRRAELVRLGVLPDPDRTGLFTTGIVSQVGGHTVTLYFTGRKHAGENLASVLDERDVGRDPPILMCDALDRNVPKGHEVIEGNCECHARRHFVDQVANFPGECRFILEELGKVFRVDDLCREEGLSAEDRLRRHQRESGPVMAGLKAWMESQLEEKRVEPNSGLGDAFNYMLKRWDKLTLFLRIPGAELHNNIVERALKKAIRQRRNSLFFRSQRGATVGDIYMSLIYSAELEGENAYHYLTELMRNAKAVAENPEAWLPWNYRRTLATAAGSAA